MKNSAFTILLLLTGCASHRSTLISPTLSLAEAETFVRHCSEMTASHVLESGSIESLGDLVAVGDMAVSTDGPLTVFRVQGHYPVFWIKFRSPDYLFEAVGRVFAWNERTPAVVTSADDSNGDGEINQRDFQDQAKTLLGAGVIQGAHYTVAQIVEVFNAYHRFQTESPHMILPITTTEQTLLNALHDNGLVKVSSDSYATLVNASLVFTLKHPPLGTVLHELDHALYDQEPRYRKAVAAYWAQLPPQDRAVLRAVIGKAYDVGDTSILLREFAGYAREEFKTRLFEKVQIADREAIVQSIRRLEAEFWPSLQRRPPCSNGDLFQ